DIKTVFEIGFDLDVTALIDELHLIGIGKPIVCTRSNRPCGKRAYAVAPSRGKLFYVGKVFRIAIRIPCAQRKPRYKTITLVHLPVVTEVNIPQHKLREGLTNDLFYRVRRIRGRCKPVHQVAGKAKIAIEEKLRATSPPAGVHYFTRVLQLRIQVERIPHARYELILER